MYFLVYYWYTILLDMLYNEKVVSVLLYVWIYISYKMLQAEPTIEKLTFVLFV